MSMYDNGTKDTLYYYMTEFLKEYKVSDLLDMVATVVKYEKED